MEEIMLTLPDDTKHAIVQLSMESYERGASDMLDTLLEVGLITEEAYYAMVGMMAQVHATK